MRPVVIASHRWLALLPLAVSALLILSACQSVGIVGSGTSATQQRSVAAFDVVNIDNAFEATVTVGSPQSVSVTADDNILPLVETIVRGNQLIVQMKSNFRSNATRPKIAITTPNLTGVDASGASMVTITGVKSPTFFTRASGATQVTGSGATDALTLTASGASQLKFNNLAAKKVDARASGASQIETQATEGLDAKASGASTIRYSGSPKSMTVDSSGASTVAKQ